MNKLEIRLVKTHGAGSFGRFQFMEIYRLDNTFTYLPISVCDLKFESIEEAEMFSAQINLAISKPVIDLTDDEGVV